MAEPASTPAGASPRRTRAVLAWPLIAIGMAWLYFFAGAYYGIYVSPVRLSSVVLAFLVLGGWWVLALFRPALRPRSVLTSAIGVALGAMAIATGFSRSPRISLDFLAYAVLLAGLYLLLRTLLTRPALRTRIGGLLVLLATVLVVAYLGTVLSHWMDWWAMVGRVVVPPLRPLFEGLTYGNPGLVAAMAALSYLGALGHVGLGSVRARVGMTVLGAGVLAVIVISGTRGAWGAVGVTAVVAGLLIALRPGVRSEAAARLQSRSAKVVAVVAILAVVAAALVVGPTMADRVINSGEGGRTSYWAAAIRMFGDALPTGVGPGMWAPERITYTRPPDIDFYIAHPHNVFLQVASELGIVGIVAGIYVLVVVARLVLGGIRDADPVRSRWAVIAILSTAYFAAHQLFDVFTNMPAALFVFALPIAMLDATAPPSAVSALRLPVIPRWVAPVVSISTLVVAVGWGLWSERAAARFDSSQALASSGSWQASLANAEGARALDPGWPVYQFGYAIAAARQGLGAEAEAALETAATEDGLPGAWLDLAWLRAQRGDAAGARDALDEALRLGGQQPAIAMAAGYVYEQLGDMPEAARWYAVALRLLPRLSRASFWSDPERAAAWPSIRDAALTALEPEDQADLWLSAGDLEAAREAAARIEDPGVRRTTELGIAAWGGDSGARATLEADATSSPRDTLTVGWCARLAARAGDQERAGMYRRWANIVAPQSGYFGLEVEVVDDLAPNGSVAGATWIPYGIYTYRRPTTANHLLPGMPHLQWTQEPTQEH